MLILRSEDFNMFKKKNNIILILLSVIITTFFLGCTKTSETEPSNFPLRKEVGNYIIDIEYTKYFGNYLLTKYYITTKDGSNIDGIINSVEFRYRPSYLGGSIDPLTLGINDISKLNSSSFNNDIFTHFYSYNTATEKDGTSFARKWFFSNIYKDKAYYY